MSQEVSEGIEIGGYSAYFSAVIMNAYNYVSVDNINSVLVLITTILGVIFICYKILGQITENKIKKEKLKDLRDE